MSILLQRLWRDECGLILSAELVIILTFGVIGMIVGLHSLAGAINCEFQDLAGAVSSIRQGYAYSGFSARGSCGRRGAFRTKSYVLGSSFDDGGARCTNVAFAEDIGHAPATQHAEVVVEEAATVEIHELPTVVEECVESESGPKVIVPCEPHGDRGRRDHVDHKRSKQFLRPHQDNFSNEFVPPKSRPHSSNRPPQHPPINDVNRPLNRPSD